ncbi:hypothetical protein Tco_0338997, partial [Tanacetum coccineum]
IATGAEPLKSKKQRNADSSKSSEDTPIRKSTQVKRSAKVSSGGSKKKATAKADTRKGLKVLSEVAHSEETQLKGVLKRSKQDFHISQASGFGDGTNEGTDSDKDDDDDEEASDNDNVADDDDDNAEDDDDGNDHGDDDDDNNDDENVDDEEQQEEEKEE